MILPKHRPQAAHLPEEPLHDFRAAAQIGGHNLAALTSEILKKRTGLEDADRLAAAGRIVVHDRRNAVVGGNRQKLRLKLLSLTDVDRFDGIGETGLLQKDGDLVAVRRGPIIEVDHLLLFLSFNLGGHSSPRRSRGREGLEPGLTFFAVFCVFWVFFSSLLLLNAGLKSR